MAFTLKPGLTFYLASASPRRKDLLSSLGIPFAILKQNISEPPPTGEMASEYAKKLAKLKGHTVTSPTSGAIILAADTVVCVDGQILGKPKDQDHALWMLELLNGRQHEVTTAIYIRGPNKVDEITLAQSTTVWFHLWPRDVLKSYADCGEPMDKAGAYAIQGKGAFLIDRIDGSWTNVVGLPLSLLVSTLLDAGLIAAVLP